MKMKKMKKSKHRNKKDKRNKKNEKSKVNKAAFSKLYEAKNPDEDKRISEATFSQLSEAKDSEKDGKTWEVVLIKAGQSGNRNYWPSKVLKEAAPLFEGAKALARSDDDHIKDRNKSVNNVVGWFDNVRFERDSLIATFHLSEAAARLKTLIKDAWDQGKKDLVGFSIVAEAKYKLKRTEKGLVRMVESILNVDSVDVVVTPAAGGKFLKMVAAKSNNQTLEDKELNLFESNLKLLETRVPELYAKLDKDNVTPEQINELLTEALDARSAPVEPEKKVQEEDRKENKKQLGKKDDNDSKNNDMGKLLTEARADIDKFKSDLKAEADKEREALKLQACKGILTEALNNTDLPQPLKEQVKSRFDGRIFDNKELIDELKVQKDTLAKLSESGKVTDTGVTAEVGRDESEKIVLALDGFFADKNINKVPRYRSFREAYVDITGDKKFTGRLQEASNLHKFAKFSEALTSASWDQILGDSIRRRMLTEYVSPGLSAWRRIVSDIVPINDFRSNKRMRLGGYGLLPSVGEQDTYQPLASPSDEEANYSVGKYGGLETVTMEMIANDDVAAIRRIPRRLGRSAAITLYRFVMDFILSNPNTTYDSKALFHADHNNAGNSELTAESLLAAKIAMADQTAYGTDTDILALVPLFLLIPNELQDIAFRLTTSPNAVAAQTPPQRQGDNEPNLHATYGLEPIVIPYWNDSKDWALVCNPAECPTIEVGFFQGREEPELFVQDQPTAGSMFSSDKITYKMRHIYGGTVVDHRGLFKASVP